MNWFLGCCCCGKSAAVELLIWLFQIIVNWFLGGCCCGKSAAVKLPCTWTRPSFFSTSWTHLHHAQSLNHFGHFFVPTSQPRENAKLSQSGEESLGESSSQAGGPLCTTVPLLNPPLLSCYTPVLWTARALPSSAAHTVPPSSSCDSRNLILLPNKSTTVGKQICPPRAMENFVKMTRHSTFYSDTHKNSNLFVKLCESGVLKVMEWFTREAQT